MKITLEGQEAEDYIKYLADKDQETPIVQPVKKPTGSIVDHQTQMMHDLEFAATSRVPRFKAVHKPHSYPAGVTRESVLRPRWSNIEIGVLNFRINPLTGAATSERTLANALLKLPERSESAIRCKILDLGGCVTDGIILKAD